jgi:hypothetical protein
MMSLPSSRTLTKSDERVAKGSRRSSANVPLFPLLHGVRRTNQLLYPPSELHHLPVNTGKTEEEGSGKEKGRGNGSENASLRRNLRMRDDTELGRAVGEGFIWGSPLYS